MTMADSSCTPIYKEIRSKRLKLVTGSSTGEKLQKRNINNGKSHQNYSSLLVQRDSGQQQTQAQHDQHRQLQQPGPQPAQLGPDFRGQLDLDLGTAVVADDRVTVGRLHGGRGGQPEGVKGEGRGRKRT